MPNRREVRDSARHTGLFNVSSQAREIKIVDDNSHEASCAGGDGDGLGHPEIYLQFDGRKWVDCYYCGQRFAKSDYESPDNHAQAS
jgi:uncharacterized Zn-finger protein